jgi:hypothetical protein
VRVLCSFKVHFLVRSSWTLSSWTQACLQLNEIFSLEDYVFANCVLAP